MESFPVFPNQENQENKEDFLNSPDAEESDLLSENALDDDLEMKEGLEDLPI